MSTQTSLTINFHENILIELSPIKLIYILLEAGWTINDYGGSTYLPLGDLV